jgi:tetratricopeptide (TPR) repeat protein
MSYINDALKKAQQEKDNLYSHYGGIISRLPGSQPHTRTKWMVLSIVVLLVLAFFFLWMAFSVPPDRRMALKAEGPVKSTAMTAQTVLPVPQQTLPPENAGADKAVPPTAPAIKAPVTSASSLYREAQAAQQRRKTEEAQRLYRRVLTIDAGHVQAMNNLGVIYMSQNKQRQAIDLFNKAILLKKDYVDPYYNLACLYARQNNRAGSIRSLKAAIAVNREVIEWAKNDMDLKNVSESEEFRKLVENKGE